MKDKNVAGILALFLGGFGIHRFYLGQSGLGILHLVFFWTPISWIIGLINAIIFFAMDPERFDRKYNRGERSRTTDFDRPSLEERRKRRYATRRERYGRRHEKRVAPSTRPHHRSKPNPYKRSGVKKFKEYEYEEAIRDFNKALEINPADVATHFNIACAYSLTEKAGLAFQHLDQAVQYGFNDFKRIKEHDALAYLRIQDEFDTFERNGYRLEAPQKIEAPKEEDLLSSQPDLLDQLKKLAELRENGLISEEEYAEERKKLLG